jgi:hypothetical protein
MARPRHSLRRSLLRLRLLLLLLLRLLTSRPAPAC